MDCKNELPGQNRAGPGGEVREQHVSTRREFKVAHGTLDEDLVGGGRDGRGRKAIAGRTDGKNDVRKQ